MFHLDLIDRCQVDMVKSKLFYWTTETVNPGQNIQVCFPPGKCLALYPVDNKAKEQIVCFFHRVGGYVDNTFSRQDICIWSDRRESCCVIKWSDLSPSHVVRGNDPVGRVTLSSHPRLLPPWSPPPIITINTTPTTTLRARPLTV